MPCLLALSPDTTLRVKGGTFRRGSAPGVWKRNVSKVISDHIIFIIFPWPLPAGPILPQGPAANEGMLHTHTCTCVYMHTRTHACAHTHMPTRTYMHAHTHTRMHTRTYTHACTHAHTRMHICTHTCPHAHTHAHTHIHACTYAHASTHAHRVRSTFSSLPENLQDKFSGCFYQSCRSRQL